LEEKGIERGKETFLKRLRFPFSVFKSALDFGFKSLIFGRQSLNPLKDFAIIVQFYFSISYKFLWEKNHGILFFRAVSHFW